MAGKVSIKQLENSTYNLLKRASQVAANLYLEKNGNSGLTQRQFVVLMAINHNDGISQAGLVDITGIDRSTMAELTGRLVAQGYIRSRKDKNDGRRNVLKLTAPGRRAMGEASPGIASVDRKLSSLIPVEHRKSFRKALKILAEYQPPDKLKKT